MTVQQERPTAATQPTAPAVQLPQQRSAGHDEQAPTPKAPAVAPPKGWATAEDRTICRWLMVGMLILSLYASLMVTLGSRVWS